MSPSSESNTLEKNNRNRREERKESIIQSLLGLLPAASLSPGPGLNEVLWQKSPASFAYHLGYLGWSWWETDTDAILSSGFLFCPYSLLPAFCLGMLPENWLCRPLVILGPQPGTRRKAFCRSLHQFPLLCKIQSYNKLLIPYHSNDGAFLIKA